MIIRIIRIRIPVLLLLWGFRQELWHWRKWWKLYCERSRTESPFVWCWFPAFPFLRATRKCRPSIKSRYHSFVARPDCSGEEISNQPPGNPLFAAIHNVKVALSDGPRFYVGHVTAGSRLRNCQTDILFATYHWTHYQRF